ncbi:MAG: hypothetical protein RMK97_00445 [Sutterellaceae bacterium]|nr:hypothetical protein [Burkholderiaceae bacterium]MCX7901099.1 hypothetical protein [Burkholderiaceae bacterium]MDW8428971.1 hypothetical protein [Sutterellaceae bacterium]
MTSQATGLHRVRCTTAALMLLALAGCASFESPQVYGPADVMQKMVVRRGVIVALREVTMQGVPSGSGAAVGVGLGALAGSNVGSGRGQIAGGIVGAGVGQAVGAATERKLVQQVGLEITFREDGSGAEFVVVQPKDETQTLRVGDRIRIVEGAQSVRVFKDG